MLLFRHIPKSSVAQEERLAASPKFVIRLHLSHAIKGMLHVHKVDIVILTSETASCHFSLHACYRSIFVLTSLANTRAGQSKRCVPPTPIRTPEWSSRLSGQRRILFTQPRGTTEHERQLVISFRGLYFPKCICPPRLSIVGHRANLIWGDRDMARGCPS